jgi:predicted dehydrogenase
MYKIKIFGAGSIGNHLCNACRNKGWSVTVSDLDNLALDRTRNDIYPSRYGSWDNDIKLMNSKTVDFEKYDLIIIGTPPDTHLKIAIDILNSIPPKIILIEKPMLTPDLNGAQELFELAKQKGTEICIGYNHTLTQNTIKAEELLKRNLIGSPLTITSMTREHWGGIFAAHPWLNGPEDTYLGYYTRGGGACLEHSHAINMWQHFSHVLQLGKVTKVSALLNFVKKGNAEYDDLCFINVTTDKGFKGNIIQDVVTYPTQKNVRIQGTNGFLEWHVNYKEGHDAVIYGDLKKHEELLIKKKRPDDFKGEIDHLEDIIKHGIKPNSPISIERGLDTMLIIAATFLSAKEKREIEINYEKGYSINSLS